LGHDLSDIATHQFSLNPQHAIPEPREVAVPPRIRSAAKFMRPIINFNYQLCVGSDKIQDVAINGHLAFEGYSKLLAGNPAPKNLFRFGEIAPHKVRSLRKQRLELELLTRLPLHEYLRCPANQPGFAPHGARVMTCASREHRVLTARGGLLRRSAETG